MKKKKEYAVTKPMHKPPHPGAILRDALDTLDLTVTEAALRLDVDRVTLSRVLHEQSGISVEMALRLAKALSTTPEVWLNMQRNYDVWKTKENRAFNLARVQHFDYAPI